MRKKVRLVIPELVKEILEKDLDYFNLKMEKLCNLILTNLGYDQIIQFHKRLEEEKKLVINFNLNEINTSSYRDMIYESNEKTETEFFRSLLSTYVSFHPSVRERILYKEIIRELYYAIKEKLKVKVLIKGSFKTIYILKLERDPTIEYNKVVLLYGNVKESYLLRDIKLVKVILK